MSANGSNGFLNIEDANLRVRSGNVYAKGITVGGITVGASHGLQSVSDVSNTTSNTLQFTNATTSFKATSNIEVGGDVSYTSKPKISVESNVVTEYTGPHDRPLRKYPEVLSPGTGIVPVSVTTPFTGLKQSWNGYEITMSSRWDSSGTYNGDHAFDDIESTIWLSGQSPATYDSNGDATSEDTLDGVDGSYLIMKLPKAIKPSYANIKTRAANDFAPRHPKTGKFYGSNDGSSWTEIGTFNYGSIPSSVYYQKFNLVGTNTYQYIAIQVHTVFNDSGPSGGTTTSVVILDLQYYGYEEGSGSLDTTLKSVYNVPATTGTQLEVYYDGRETSSYTGSGTTVTDISPNTNNGTLNGGVGFDSTYKAFTFDGTTTRNITTTLPSSVTGEYVHSVSLWVKADEVSRSGGVFTFFTIGSASSTNMIALGVNTAGDGIKYDFFNADVRVESPQIMSNEWMHFVVTYSGGANNLAGAKRIYLNGKELSVSYGGSSFSSPLSLPTSPTLTLGGQINSSNPPISGSIANFRLYSKALNADQVKELYDYQKDYFLGSKSQVTLYKGHLGVGVTEPSGQLELAGDERLQEYPPGPMGPSTSYETHIPGHGVFCWDTVNYYSGSPVENYNGSGMYAKDAHTTGWYGPYQNNNGYTGGNVYSGTDFAASTTSGLFFDDAYGTRYYGAWTTFKLPYKINLKKLHIDQWGTTDNINTRCAPEDGVILGSNDGTKWYHVHTFIGLQYGGTAGTSSYSAAGEDVTINCNTDYNQYVLITTRTLHYAFTVIIGELKWFGTPGPTTLDKGSLSLTRSLDVPRVSRYDVDTETPRPEKLLVDFDTTVNSSPTDISGKGNHGAFGGSAYYSSADKAFILANNPAAVSSASTHYIRAELNNSETGNQYHSVSLWFKVLSGQNSSWRAIFECGENPRSGNSDISLYVPGGDDKLVFAHGGSSMYTDTLTNLYFQWHHVVLTYDGANRKIYLDGTLIKTQATTTWAGVANMTLHFGRNNHSNANEGCDCHVSNFKLYWQTALEPSEVRKLYNLGRTGRSMVISDTAVGIGKVPEAQLDVRGTANFVGDVGIGTTSPGKMLDVNGTTRSRKSAGWKSGTFDSTGVNMGPMADGTTDGPQIGWEFHVTFSAATAGSRVEIYGAYKHSGPLYAASEKWTFRFKEGVGTPDYSNYAELVNDAEPLADTYYAVIRVVNSIYNNTNVVAARHHFMSHSVGCHQGIGATIWQAQGYIDMGGESSDDRFNYLRITSSSGNIKGQWTAFPITT